MSQPSIIATHPPKEDSANMSRPLPTPAELDQLAVVDPQIEALFSQMPSSWQPKSNNDVDMILEMRAGWDAMPTPPPVPEVHEETLSYTNRRGDTLRLCVYRPAAAASAALPAVVWYHGGGGCIGTPESTAPLARQWALDHQCVVIAPQYRLAPEYVFPAGVQDSWDALRHIAANSRDLGVNLLAGFVVGGESAGAVISSVLQMQGRDEHLSLPLTGAFLSAGSYFNPSAVPAEYQELYRSRTTKACTESPMLSMRSKKAFDTCFKPDYASPYLKSALWPSGHAGLPKTYLQTCGMDINRDEGILYADLMAKNGIQTRLDIYSGCPHCFWHLFPKTTQGEKWVDDTKKGLKWLLSHGG